MKLTLERLLDVELCRMKLCKLVIVNVMLMLPLITLNVKLS